jgi:acyl carrier protein
VVAAQLGVGADELTLDVSLPDELAADSLDLVELGLAFEDELGIDLPEGVLQSVRTYGDLLEAIRRREPERRVREAAAEADREPAFVWVRIVPAPQHAKGALLRAGWLTPYTAETIVADAVRSGPGSRLEICVPPAVGDAGLAELREQFAWLAERGIGVSVRRDGQPRAGHPVAAA